MRDVQLLSNTSTSSLSFGILIAKLPTSRNTENMHTEMISGILRVFFKCPQILVHEKSKIFPFVSN